MKVMIALTTAGIICAAVPAHAGICTDEIAMITKMLSGGGLGSAVSAAPSTGSTSALSAVTGGNAPSAAETAQAAKAVDQAKTADAAGDETSCMEYINQAKQLLGLIK